MINDVGWVRLEYAPSFGYETVAASIIGDNLRVASISNLFRRVKIEDLS